MNWIELGWPLLMWLILAAAGAMGCLALRGFSPTLRRRLLPLQRDWYAPWNGFDVLAMFLLWQLVPMGMYQGLVRIGFFQALTEEPGGSLRGEDSLWLQMLSLPFQLVMIVSALWLLRGAWPARLGLTCQRWAPNVVAGYLVWLAIAPPLLVLFFALLQFIPEPPHPFMNMDAASFWLLILIGVSIAAPIAEELLFRGVLLPWSLNAPLDSQLLVGVGALVMACNNGLKTEGEFDPAPMGFVAILLPGFLLLPYLVLPAQPDLEPEGPDLARRDSGLRRWWNKLVTNARRPEAGPVLAIYANGLLFGAVHKGWPLPIPLMVLGMALAWLAYRTQSLVGPIVVHALFNSVTFLTMVWKPPT